jgi:hypothetical protein
VLVLSVLNELMVRTPVLRTSSSLGTSSTSTCSTLCTSSTFSTLSTSPFSTLCTSSTFSTFTTVSVSSAS